MYVYYIQMSVLNIRFTELELKIATYLFKHYKQKYNPRQLAKLLSINHAHAHTLCNTLTKKNLLIKENLGNSFYFTYNYSTEITVQFMGYLLSLEETQIPGHLLVLRYNLQKFKPYLQLGLLFGSSIKSPNFQDIDILLMYSKSNTKQIKDIKEEIRKSQLIEKPIRYVDIRQEDIEKNKENNIFYNILSENIIFHSPTTYIKIIQTCLKQKNT